MWHKGLFEEYAFHLYQTKGIPYELIKELFESDKWCRFNFALSALQWDKQKEGK